MDPAGGKLSDAGETWFSVRWLDAARTVRSVASFVVRSGCFTGATALIVVMLLRTQEAECFIQCQCACTAADAAALRALPAGVLLSSAVQVLAALLAQVQVATGRWRRAVAFVALVVSVATKCLCLCLISILIVVFGRFFCFDVDVCPYAIAFGVGVGVATGPALAKTLLTFVTVVRGDE